MWHEVIGALNRQSKWMFILIVLLGASSYGLLTSVIKLAYDDGWNDLQISASQATLGALLMWLIVLVRPSSWSNPFKGPWIRLSVIGILGLALTTLFYNKALSQLSASMSIILLFQFTWMTIAMESIYRRKWPTRNQWLAIAVVMIGTVLAVGVSKETLEGISTAGILFGLLSGCTYGFFLFATDKVESSMDSALRSAVMLTAALPIFFLLYPPHHLIGLHHAGNLMLWGLLLGTLGQVIPTICFNIGIPRIGSSLSAMLGSVELPVALVSALIILNEDLSVLQWLGMLLILAGIFVSEKRTAH